MPLVCGLPATHCRVQCKFENFGVRAGRCSALLADRAGHVVHRPRAIESAIERSTLVPRVGEARLTLEKLERAFQKRVLRPLEAAAGKTGLEAHLPFIAAELATLWYDDLGLVHAAQRVIAGQFPGYPKCVDEAALNRKLRLVDAIVKLAT